MSTNIDNAIKLLKEGSVEEAMQLLTEAADNNISDLQLVTAGVKYLKDKKKDYNTSNEAKKAANDICEKYENGKTIGLVFKTKVVDGVPVIMTYDAKGETFLDFMYMKNATNKKGVMKSGSISKSKLLRLVKKQDTK